MTSRLSMLGEHQNRKNPTLYYSSLWLGSYYMKSDVFFVSLKFNSQFFLWQPCGVKTINSGLVERKHLNYKCRQT